MDLIGPAEARILSIERKQARIDDILRRDKRKVIGLGQEIWDTAGGLGSLPVVVVTPPAPCTTAFPGACACIPLILKATDSYWGDQLITYDAVNHLWKGSRVVSYPGSSTCPADTPTVTWILLPSGSGNSWFVQVIWTEQVYPFVLGTPATNTCPIITSSPHNNRTLSAAITFLCPPTISVSANFATGTGYRSIYPDGVVANLTIGPP